MDQERDSLSAFSPENDNGKRKESKPSTENGDKDRGKEGYENSVGQQLVGFSLGVFACFTAMLGTASAQGLQVGMT